MIQIEFINPIKNAERIVNSVNGMIGDVVLTIPSIEGLATEEYVEKKVAEAAAGGQIDLDNYATKKYVEISLEGYATETYVQEQIEAIPETDLSGYYTKTETDTAISDAQYAVTRKIPSKVSELENDANYVTEEDLGNVSVDLTGYATETYVQEQIEAIPAVDLEPYALKTDIPDVSGYQTADDVQAAITAALGEIGVAEEGEY